MSFVRLVGNDEPEEDRHRLAIGRVEGNGKLCSYECGGRHGTLIHACMRNRDAVTHARRAQLLAHCQALQNECLGESMPRGKQGGDLFEQLRFGRHVEFQADVVKSQQFADGIHDV